ncbi:MAG TPA: ankyrin repeat domain-containing protein [Ohtaekwangia sp.]|uniref:ankyrin repeat domain-containing protein n=1 Tax=Ohtaekwangia sp. TaxID=2066019 RepID=UPI002F92F791
MNKFVRLIKTLDPIRIEDLLRKEPEWTTWSEPDGKNGLHYLCALAIAGNPEKVSNSLKILKLLLKKGVHINSVHRIPDPGCGYFPATPLWYAYARGRNEKLVRYLLSKGADPEHCMFALTWNDDVKLAKLFLKHGATIDDTSTTTDTPFLGACNWKRFTIAEWFLKNGADVNATDSDGNTALHHAVRKKYKTEHIALLLRYGADYNKPNKQGISAKQLAESNHQRKILNLFQV